MKITFPIKGNIEIKPQTDLEKYALNRFLNEYHKKLASIIIYENKTTDIKTIIKYNKGK